MGKEPDEAESDYYADYDEDDDTCMHEDADVDSLTGVLSCACGYRRILSDAELQREVEAQVRLYELYVHECEESNPDTNPGDAP